MATRQRPTSQERLAKQVLDILVGRGLNHTGTILVGGRNFYFPQVVEVVDFPHGVEVVDGPVATPAHRRSGLLGEELYAGVRHSIVGT
ncbi:MAG: hypothetical protein ACRDTH_08400 [Pseudonocardiaceae bacterium]